MEFLIWLIAGLMIGAAAGAAVMWLMNQKRDSGESVENIRRENAQFREEVSEHFVETARLINQLTDSYKEVFDHLSQGAEKLVDDRVLAERMPQVSRREVRLHHLGSTESGDAGGGEPKKTDSTGSRPTGSDPLKKSSGAGSNDAGKQEGDDSSNKSQQKASGKAESESDVKGKNVKDKARASGSKA